MSDYASDAPFPPEPTPAVKLETAYRTLLRRYPAAYRSAREEEMVGTLMEASEPGQHKPSAADRRDLTIGALKAQLRINVLGMNPRAALNAVALPAAVIALGLTVLGGVVSLFMIRLTSDYLTTTPGYEVDKLLHRGAIPVEIVTWLGVVIALMTGRVRLGRILAVATILVSEAPQVITAAMGHHGGWWPFGAGLTTLLAVVVAAANPTARPSRRPALALLAGVLPTTVAATAFLVGMWDAPAEGPHPFIPDQAIAVLIGGIGAVWWLIRTDPQAGVSGSVLLAAALLPPAVDELLFLAFDQSLPGVEQLARLLFGAVLLYACALSVSRRLLNASPPSGPHAA
jgi:hypothetical protein